MYSNWSYSPETPNLGQIRRFLEPCDLEIWRMTLKNNRAPLLCCFGLCAWFHCHVWIQTSYSQQRPFTSMNHCSETVESHDNTKFLSINIPFIPCQDYGWGQRSRSYSGCNILSIHIPFIPCQLDHHFLECQLRFAHGNSLLLKGMMSE